MNKSIYASKRLIEDKRSISTTSGEGGVRSRGGVSTVGDRNSISKTSAAFGCMIADRLTTYYTTTINYY